MAELSLPLQGPGGWGEETEAPPASGEFERQPLREGGDPEDSTHSAWSREAYPGYLMLNAPNGGENPWRSQPQDHPFSFYRAN